jgi:SAM-dependent methyltransferase
MADRTATTVEDPDGTATTVGDSDRTAAMEAEFDVVARWTLDAVRQLGEDHAVPAGCRGSASPAALAWLGEACELSNGTALLDVGGGVGGPSAYAAERFGVRPILVEPMIGACRAAAALFGLPIIAGAGERLPLASGSVSAAWCLGVLCTTQEKAALLGELRRVLVPGGRLGLLVFVADEPHPAGAPEGNQFPTEADLDSGLEQAGFEVVEQADLADFAEAPLSWTERADRVEQAIERAHAGDPRLAVARDQEQRIGRLLAGGQVSGRLVHAVAR